MQFIRIFLFTAFLLPATQKLFSQNNLPTLYKLGMRQYADGAEDSAYQTFVQAEQLIRSRKLHEDPLSSATFNFLGNWHKEREQVADAHKWYGLALSNARQYDHVEARIAAFAGLNQLHWLITVNDLPFNYLPPRETVVEDVFFQIEKVMPYRDDTVMLQVLGGRNDGIRDSILRADVYRSRINRGADEETLAALGKAVLQNAGHNKSIFTLVVTNRAEMPKSGDLIRMFAHTPVHMVKARYNDYLKNNINLISNDKERIVSRRFLYYYGDSLTNKDVMRAFKYALIEIVQLLKEDSTGFEPLFRPVADGIYRGKTGMQVMDEAGTKEINHFLGFVKDRPGNYMGATHLFSEMFATWVFNNAPLAEDDIKEEVVLDYLDKKNSDACRKLHQQIVTGGLVKKWVDKGMEAVARNQLTENFGFVYALSWYGKQMKNDTAQAWGNFLLALGDYNVNNIASGEENLLQAERLFKALAHEEGLSLCRAVRTKFMGATNVSLNVQTGHFGAYRVAMSPNPAIFATGGDDYLVKLWDAELGKEFKTLRLHRDEVTGIAWSPDGRFLYTSSLDSSIIVWNTFSYEPVRILRPGFRVGKISVSNNGEQLAVTAYDSVVRIVHAVTGNVVRMLRAHKATVTSVAFLPNADNFVFSAGADSLIYKWNISDGVYTRWFKEKGKVISLTLSGNGRFMASVSTDGKMNVWDISSYRFLFKTPVNRYAVRNSSNYYSDPVFSPDSRLLIYASEDGKWNFCDPETSSYIGFFPPRSGFPEQFHFAANGQTLFVHYPFDNTVVKADMSAFPGIYKQPKRPPSVDIFNYYNPTVVLDFSDDGKELFVMATDVSALNLQTGATVKLGYSPQFVWNERFMWKGRDFMAQVHDRLGAFVVTRNEKGASDTVYHYLPKHMQAIQAVSWTRSGDAVFLAGDSGRIAGYRFSENRELFNHTIPTGGKVKWMYADSTAGQLYLIADSAGTSQVHVVSMDGTHKAVWQHTFALKMQPFGSHVYLLNQKGELQKRKSADGSIEKTWGPFAPAGTNYAGEFFAVSPHEQQAVVQTDANHIVFLDLGTGVAAPPVYDHDFMGGDICYSPDGKLVVTAGFDSKIHLYNPLTGKRQLNGYVPLNEEIILSDEAGHYLASKKALNGLVFTLNDKPYDFEQFDLYFNRPDIILGKLPEADTVLLHTYRAAWQRRMRRAGLPENASLSVKRLPSISLRNKTADVVNTTASSVMLDVECTGGAFPLSALQVTVNNNPVFAGKGKALAQGDFIRDSVWVPLAFGRNVIRYYCTNTGGVTSLRETVVINCNYRSRKPVTYFIGIAVSEYKDSRMNLQYPVKDVRDLLQTFAKRADSLVVDTLMNHAATRKNILALKPKLQRLEPGDKVIIAVTGHGLLDSQYDFYYATWDVDFEKPELQGLKYELLEGLADGISVQRKLILIDACHSGALDKEEMQQTSLTIGQGGEAGTVKGTRGVKLPKVAPEQARISTFDLMQSQFTDVVNNNGAVIISAAGGMEYAFESEQWHNGVFTYCLRNALENKLADFSVHGNMDGRVSVMELMKYVNERVQQLTRGKQKPVSRRENVAFDWMVAE